MGPYETSVDIPAGLDIQNLAGGFDHKIKVHNPKYPYREHCIVIVLTTACAARINLLEKTITYKKQVTQLALLLFFSFSCDCQGQKIKY